MDCVLATKELDALAESEKAQEPAHEVLWSAGGYKSAHGREEHGVKRIVEPGIVDVSVWLSEVREQEKEAQRRQHHGECPQRPSEPCGGRCGGSSHPILAPVPLPLLSQHHTTALPSPKRYGNRYEREDPGRTSENTYSTQFVNKQECSQECNPKGSGYRE